MRNDIKAILLSSNDFGKDLEVYLTKKVDDTNLAIQGVQTLTEYKEVLQDILNKFNFSNLIIE